ncbi:MAG: LexA family transcriptional regulator [Oscillospiraceae bacterium]|nr:LexA family transcriptional regulator [Oscillospiraceae bacterium]
MAAIVGQNIKRLREERRLTQKQLGDAVGVSNRTVSTWEIGTKMPRGPVVKKLAAYFGISEGELLAGPSSAFISLLDHICRQYRVMSDVVALNVQIPRDRFVRLQEGEDAPTLSDMRALAAFGGETASFDFRDPAPLGAPLAVPPTAAPHAAVPQAAAAVSPAVLPWSVTRRVPLFASAPIDGAAIDGAAIDDTGAGDVLDTLDFRAPDGAAYFALIACGDSMYPDYRDGDVLIVRRQDDARTGDDVIAVTDSGETLFKRLYKTRTGLILRSCNKACEPQVFTLEDLHRGAVRIVGVVAEQRRRHG